MGGGRCTKAGCICYMAFFDYDGSPTSYYYPEDNMWYSFTHRCTWNNLILFVMSNLWFYVSFLSD